MASSQGLCVQILRVVQYQWGALKDPRLVYVVLHLTKNSLNNNYTCCYIINTFPTKFLYKVWDHIIMMNTCSMFDSNPCRPFPIVLPHRLLPWLHRNGCFPDVSETERQQFWAHLKKRDVGIANVVSEDMACWTHPLYMWADDAQYNEQRQKLITIVVGHCLDRNTYSIQTCWPVFCIREDPCLCINWPVVCFFLLPN